MDPSEIKSLRRQIGLTQIDLANKAGVSQSLIAKIESNRIDPTFSNMKRITEALESQQQKESRQAKDFIHKGMVYCIENDDIKIVIEKMKKYEISQLPVMKEDVVIGMVSESKIIEQILNNKQNLKAKDVMGEIPPIIAMNTPESVISSMLKFFSLVIVQDKGKTKGVITRADILRKVYA
jgi:predicted transcriptional regulator